MQLDGKANPKVSVVMSTYNDGKYVYEAVTSILNQTFTDLELIIINDASTDNTFEIISKIEDPRVVILSNETNQGLPYSLNRGFRIARGKYIARMDGDDISLPERIQKQYDYMENHPDVAICGCNFKHFERSNVVVACPEDSDAIKVKILYGSPLAHSSWFIRKKDFDNLNVRYNEKFKSSQDYELMYRIKDKCKLACVQEILLLYRVRKNSITGRTKGVDKNQVKVYKRILRDLRISVNERNLYLMSNRFCINTIADYICVIILFLSIVKHNKKYGVFPQEALLKEIKERICDNGSRCLGIKRWKTF